MDYAYGGIRAILLNPDDPSYAAAENTAIVPGYLTLIAHASPNYFDMLTPDQLANYIQSLYGYKAGMPVILDGCRAGQGSPSYSDKLATLLHANVIAADEKTWAVPIVNTELSMPHPQLFSIFGHWGIPSAHQ